MHKLCFPSLYDVFLDTLYVLKYMMFTLFLTKYLILNDLYLRTKRLYTFFVPWVYIVCYLCINFCSTGVPSSKSLIIIFQLHNFLFGSLLYIIFFFVSPVHCLHCYGELFHNVFSSVPTIQNTENMEHLFIRIQNFVSNSFIR